MELVLPSGRRVRVKLKKHEFSKIEDEVRLYRIQRKTPTWRQFFRLFWTRKVKVAWIRIKEWVKRRRG
jgi:phage-related protein